MRFATACLIMFWPALGLAEIPVAVCADSQSKTIVVVVRHAERNGTERLVEAGWERARTLRDILFQRFTSVDAVLHTTVERTGETVRPTRRKAGDIPAYSREPQDYAGFARLIRVEHAKGRPQAVLLYAGHSNTIKPILSRLNPEQVSRHAKQWFSCDPDLCHSDYDDLWTVTLCGSAPPPIRKTEYGNQTASE